MKVRILEDIDTGKGVIPKGAIIERNSDLEYIYVSEGIELLSFGQSVLDAMRQGLITGFRWEYVEE